MIIMMMTMMWWSAMMSIMMTIMIVLFILLQREHITYRDFTINSLSITHCYSLYYSLALDFSLHSTTIAVVSVVIRSVQLSLSTVAEVEMLRGKLLRPCCACRWSSIRTSSNVHMFKIYIIYIYDIYIYHIIFIYLIAFTWLIIKCVRVYLIWKYWRKAWEGSNLHNTCPILLPCLEACPSRKGPIFPACGTVSRKRKTMHKSPQCFLYCEGYAQAMRNVDQRGTESSVSFAC